MLLESKVFWLTVFYLLWSLAVVFVISVNRILTRARFRSEQTESTEVGYEEDSTGHLLRHPEATDIILGLDDQSAMPHFAPSGGSCNNGGGAF
jgi:hypothetical protein